MKIFVAGATGVLGKRVVKLLAEAGHDVIGIARSGAKATLLTSLHATPARVDLFDAEAVRKASEGCDVVMNLATHIPMPSKAMLPGAWSDNEKIRSEGSRILVDAALANGAKRYIQESIAFVYPDSGGRVLDETVELDLPKRIDGVAQAEANAARFTDAGGVGVVLRFGTFYAADTGHTQMQLRTARRGFWPFPGPADGYVSLIQLDDAARAVVAALDVDAGTYNVVDDEPMTREAIAQVVADALGKKKLRPVPRALMRGALGLLARSQRVSNAKFKQATGWTPHYPSAREGWPAAVAEAGLAGSKT